jgi:hypothetical protein
MKRRLAVPLAISDLGDSGQNVMRKTRKLRVPGADPESQKILGKLAENRSRIESLEKDIWECDDIVEEIAFLRANIELGLVEIAGGLDEIRSSEEILAQGMA